MQYEADKLIHLLHFCCWKSRCTPDQKGFRELTTKIDNSLEKGQISPGERYLADLYSEATVAAKNDNLIGRKENFIGVILQFAGYQSWSYWEDALYNAGEYLDFDAVDLTVFSKMETVVCFPSSTEGPLLPDLSYAQRFSQHSFQLLACKESSFSENLSFVLEQLHAFPCAIMVLPYEWKDRVPTSNDPGWKSLVETKRIIPVWLQEQNMWSTKPALVGWLNPRQTIGGIPGVLTSLMYVQEALKKITASGPSQKASPYSAGNTQVIHNHGRAVNLNGVVINTEHTTMGNSQINYHKTTKHDS